MKRRPVNAKRRGHDRYRPQGTARDSTYISRDVPCEYQAVGQALTGLLQEGRLRYRFSGALTAATPVGDRRVPFSGTGTITP
jgi:hypothetical protein